MESLIKNWDGESIVLHYDQQTGAWIIIAIHSTRLGPATGGTRMKQYPDLDSALEDALRLSAGMTYKFAVPGLRRGGGKAVISVPAGLDSPGRIDLLRRYGRLIHQLGGLFYTGPDVGTSSADMDVIAETGAPYVFSRTPTAGGAGSPGPYTALGVFSGIQTAWQYITGSETLERCRVLVQGTGSVGSRLISLLLDAEAEVLFSEVEEEAIQRFRDELKLPLVAADEVYETACDVFAPCALGGVLNAQTIPKLKCRAVVGGANNQLVALENAVALLDRGILYGPDYVVNVGGAMAITGIETQGWTPEEAGKRVVSTVRNTLKRIFEISGSEGVTTEVAARLLAEEHLSKAD
jgi:leucine dehydrogenase